MDVSGHWSFTQSNGPRVEVYLEQFDVGFGGDKVTGRASYNGTWGYLSGNVRPDSSGLFFRAAWNDGKFGLYDGRFNGQGFLVGETHNEHNPAESASWRSDRAFH